MTSNAFSLAGVLALLLVACAAALDVLANLLLARSDGFRRRLTGCAALVCIGAAFYCLSLALHHMDLSVAYALWGSFGILGTVIEIEGGGRIQSSLFRHLFIDFDGWILLPHGV